MIERYNMCKVGNIFPKEELEYNNDPKALHYVPIINNIDKINIDVDVWKKL
jgi:hypothetical protein